LSSEPISGSCRAMNWNSSRTIIACPSAASSPKAAKAARQLESGSSA
jgi:hypothetical protein